MQHPRDRTGNVRCRRGVCLAHADPLPEDLMSKRLLFCSLAFLGAVAAGCGSDTATKQSAVNGERTIKVVMKDNAFSPTALTVKAGETIRFEFDNTGAVDHEAILGDERVQATHEQEMTKPGPASTTTADETHGMGHESPTTVAPIDGDGKAHNQAMSPGALSVKPGKTGSVVHVFKPSDNGLIIGCHEVGHYQAGMMLKVSVEA